MTDRCENSFAVANNVSVGVKLSALRHDVGRQRSLPAKQRLRDRIEGLLETVDQDATAPVLSCKVRMGARVTHTAPLAVAQTGSAGVVVELALDEARHIRSCTSDSSHNFLNRLNARFETFPHRLQI